MPYLDRMGMQACGNCGTDNPEGARFCMSCGNALARTLSQLRDARSGRGALLHVRAASRSRLTRPRRRPQPPPAPAPTPASELPEERRQVTVVFADLSGYTAVAERMDPEAVKSLVDRALRRLGEEVDRFGGRVDKYIGDNVMAVFGAPIAHEDDAERAVRAALGMQDAMTEINESLGATHGVNLALRVGVNTGEVVAGAVGDGYTVIGDTVNVAARLQSAAQPGSVTVGERTFRATSQAIDYTQLEPLTLKGKAAASGRHGRRPGRWHASSPRRTSFGETPLVGRDDKLELLRSVYDRVERERRAHLVTVIGQAGVGKSRLRQELERLLGQRHPPPTFREGRCLPYGSGIVYWALGEVIRAEAGIVDGDSTRGGLGQAARVGRGPDADLRRARRAAGAQGCRDRAPARHRGAARHPAVRGRGPAAHARGVLLRRAVGDRGAWRGETRWCSCSRTSTGPTTECST